MAYENHTRVMFFYSILNSSTLTSFHAWAFSIFFSLITSLIVLFPKKTSCKKKSPNLSSIRWTRFFIEIIQHCETWNVICLFPLCNLEETHRMNSLFYTVKLAKSYKLYHTIFFTGLTRWLRMTSILVWFQMLIFLYWVILLAFSWSWI